MEKRLDHDTLFASAAIEFMLGDKYDDNPGSPLPGEPKASPAGLGSQMGKGEGSAVARGRTVQRGRVLGGMSNSSLLSSASKAAHHVLLRNE
jgi:hypothetical protein